MHQGPLFERDTSVLYASNDGRVRVEKRPGKGGRVILDTVHVVLIDGKDYLTTKNRTLADAFIAGWDACNDHPF